VVGTANYKICWGVVMATINLHLGDSLAAMRAMPDQCYDLAIVDPPYFEEFGKKNYTGNEYSTTGVKRHHNSFNFWDVPQQDYFDHLFRISKNQIIWGANYYAKFIPNVGRIVWDKRNDSSTFSKCEIASHSFGVRVDLFRYEWNGMLQQNMKNKEKRVHPCQKPVALYQWCLERYAQPGDRILDTHLGSGSIAIACHNMGYDLDAWELDPEYHAAAVARFTQHTQQLQLPW